MSTAEWLDWSFSPIRWLYRTLPSDLYSGSLLADFVVLFLIASGIVLSAAMILGFIAHEVLFRLDYGLMLASRWASRGADVVTMRAWVRRYTGVSSALGWARARTGVGYAAHEDRAPGLDAPPASFRARCLQCLVNALLTLPYLIGGAARTLMLWLRAPLGIYVVLGSAWTIFRPALPPVAGATDLLGALGYGTILAAAGLALAVAAVGLDHGLTIRRRGRNGYARQMATEAEGVLALMATESSAVLEILDNAIQDFVRSVRTTTSDVVSDATAGTFEVLNGVVKPSRSSSFHRGRHGVADLRHHASGQADIDSVLAPLRSRVAEDVMFRHLLRQAPRGARGMLFDVRRDHPQTSGAEGNGSKPQPRVISLLSQERLDDCHERLHDAICALNDRAKAQPVDHEDQGGPLQQIMNNYWEKRHNELWDVLEYRARVERFVDSVHAAQRNRGLVQRISSRFGG